MHDLKIAQICPKYFPSIGGVETHVKEISERLVERGFDVSVLTTDPTGNLPIEQVINGVKVRRFKSWAPSESYFFSPSLKSYLSHHSSEFDIVHAHSYHAFPSLYAAQGKGRNRLFYTPHYHGTGHTFFRSLLHKFYKYKAKKTFLNADKIIFVSNFEKSLALRNFKIPPDKCKTLGNGLKLKEFINLRKERKDNFILYVGRLEKYKGIGYIIKALSQMDSSFSLEIVGKGPYKNSLISLARKEGVEARVKFFEDLPRTQLLQKYADASIFVMLSRHESFGITIAESLAAGTPCVVANQSALMEWIDNKNCFGVNYPINIEVLASVITLASRKPVIGLHLSDWDHITALLALLYKEKSEEWKH